MVISSEHSELVKEWKLAEEGHNRRLLEIGNLIEKGLSEQEMAKLAAEIEASELRVLTIRRRMEELSIR